MARTNRDDEHIAAIVTGAADRPPAESARARAARGRLGSEGFAIDVVDTFHWKVEGFSFWPELAMWRHRDGQLGGDGLSGLVAALRQARSAARPDTTA